MDTAYGWRYAPWYGSAAGFAYGAGAAFAHGTPVAGGVAAGIGAALAGGATLALRRCRRTPAAVLRAELLALARAREGKAEAWLNRDARLLFRTGATGPRWLRLWHVARVDEDIAREIAVSDRVAATADFFTMLPVSVPVMHQAIGAVITRAGDGEFGIAEDAAGRGNGPRARFRRLRRQRLAEKAGLLHATPDDLRELIDGFRAAEPMPAGSPGGGEP